MMKKVSRITQWAFIAGAVLLLLSSVLVMERVFWGKYTFAAGVVLFAVSRQRMLYTGSDIRLKRINRLYTFTSILLVVASALQFKNNEGWIVLLLIVAITELYTSMRLTHYEKNQKE